MNRLGAAVLYGSSLAAATSAAAQHTTINPIDIDYRYNWEELNQGISYRTGADPAIVRFKGAFYLFETLADGYWRSTDLAHWTFVTPSRWPDRGIVAPAVWADADRIYIMASRMGPGPIFASSDPASGRLDYLTRLAPPLPDAVGPGQESLMEPGQIPPGPWDPALFREDDGRWFLYWNSSNRFPLYGIELDPARRLAYVGHPIPLISLHPDEHGWERFGQDHDGRFVDGAPVDPYLEGAWMTKVGGRYYLQYAAPGTEFNAYANGTYVGNSPLGPFTYAPWNPVAYKPGGFVIGAGHGSTVADQWGNWWNSGTSWIGSNWRFERRVVVFPAHFWPDGQMSVSTRFGDFPRLIPDGQVADPDSLFAGWMLLSYRKTASATSSLAEHGPANAVDENPRSFWVAANSRPGETLTIDLGGPRMLRAVQVNFADYRAGRFADAPDIYTEFALEASTDGRGWHEIARTEPPRRDRANAYLELAKPVRARFVRYVHGHIGGAHLAIADLRVFGTADGPAPHAPARFVARRDADERNATVTFTPVEGAVGYNIRWGVRPDRLTLTYQIFADSTPGRTGRLALRSLNAGVRYWAAIEAFNESGVSRLNGPVAIIGPQ